MYRPFLTRWSIIEITAIYGKILSNTQSLPRSETKGPRDGETLHCTKHIYNQALFPEEEDQKLRNHAFIRI